MPFTLRWTRKAARLPLLFVLLLLALAACDSAADPAGGPADGSDLVGAWVTETHVQTVLVTSDRDQDVVDVGRAGSGTLAFTGAASGTLRYTGQSVGSDGRTSFTVFSNDFHLHPFPDARAFLSLDPYQTTLTVWRDGAFRQFSLAHQPGTAPYQYSGGRLSVAGVRLTTAEGAAVTVSGVLDLPVLRLAAGAEQAIERQVSTEDAGERRLVFGRDGTFRSVRTDSPAFVGVWEVLGDGRIRLAGELSGGPVAEVSYRVEDSRLTLATVNETCRDDPSQQCREYVERQFALVPGSLTRVRQEIGDIYVPDR